MIAPTDYVNLQQATAVPVTKDASASTASEGIKFGDTFRTVRPVFDEEILQNANKAINEDYRNFPNPRNLPLTSRLGEVFEGGIDSQHVLSLIPDTREVKINVKFDKRCRIIDRENFKNQLVTSDEAMIELALKGVEVLARQFSLKGQSMEVFRLSIIRNYITNEGLRGGGWHRDCGDYSLVVLMNDDSVVKKNAPYYTGGGLETAKFASKHWTTGTLAVEGTRESHPYERNCGYAFSNTGELIHQGAGGEYVSVNPEEPQPEEPQEEPLEKRLLLIIMSHPSQSATTPEQKDNLSNLFGRVKSRFFS